MEIRGIMSLYQLSDAEKDTFAEFLQHSLNTPIIEFIRYYLGDDYLQFLDIMSGTNFKVPASKTLTRDLEAVRIYVYVRNKEFSDVGLEMASDFFGKTILNVRRSVYRVAKVLGIEDTLEGDALNNYILLIKNVEEGVESID